MLYRFTPETPAMPKVWNRNPNMGKGSVTFADGNLYCYENTGTVRLIKATPAGYKEEGEFRIPEAGRIRNTWTHPVVANGKLYLRDQNLIFCYDVHKSSP